MGSERGSDVADKPGKTAPATEREAELEAQLWQSLAAADKREARLEGQLKAAQEREAALKDQLAAAQGRAAADKEPLRVAQDRAATLRAQLDDAYRQAAALSDQLAAANKRIAEQARQLEQAAEREADLKGTVERLQQQQRLALTAHIGDVPGEVSVAGHDVIKASPGELRDCPFCAGEGRFTRMEGADRVIVLCQNCRGLGQVRL